MSNEMFYFVCFVMFALNMWRRFCDLTRDKDMGVSILLSQLFFVSVLGCVDIISGFGVAMVTYGSWWAVSIGLGKKEFGLDEED